VVDSLQYSGMTGVGYFFGKIAEQLRVPLRTLSVGVVTNQRRCFAVPVEVRVRKTLPARSGRSIVDATSPAAASAANANVARPERARRGTAVSVPLPVGLRVRPSRRSCRCSACGGVSRLPAAHCCSVAASLSAVSAAAIATPASVQRVPH
jgi:hypothetical protein